MKRFDFKKNNIEIEKLNTQIQERLIDSDNIHVGDFISLLNLNERKIENKYIVTSITKLFNNHNIKIECYNIIKGGFEIFEKKEDIKYLIRPNETDEYKYVFNIPYAYSFNIGDYVKFIKPINHTYDHFSNNDIFIIKRAYNTKYGCVVVDLIGAASRISLCNVPIIFLEKTNMDQEIKENNKMVNLNDKDKIININNIKEKDDLELIKSKYNLNINNKEELKEKEIKENNKMVNLNDISNNINGGYSIEVFNIKEKDQKIICIFDLSKEIEIARFTLDKNDSFTNKMIKEYINKIIFA